MHRRVKPITIVDGAILGEIEDLRQTLRLAQQTEKFDPKVGEGSVAALEHQLAELAQKAATAALVLKVQTLPGEAFDEIVRHHPPTAAQFDHYREQLKAAPWLGGMLQPPQMNPDTMGPVLLAACLVDPIWSDAEVGEFWRERSKGEQNYLWNTIHDLQVDEALGADLPFFNAATATTNGGGVLSTSPANEASPPPTS